MSDWKVFANKAQLIPHPNAEKLVIVKVGAYSIVAGKDNGYKDGDIVVLAPEKSILPSEIHSNYVGASGESYLGGPNKDRVKSIRLRGELSMGVSLNRDWVLSKLGLNSIDEISLDVDLSEKLGIVKFEAPIPVALAGEVEPIAGISHVRHHDVEQFRLYANEFQEGEEVSASEKLHGSMLTAIRQANSFNADGSIEFGKWLISSKGISKRDLAIKESAGNTYWQAFHNTDLATIFSVSSPGDEIQLFSEVLPVQKGFSYGQTKPTLKIFRLIINGRELEWDEIKSYPDEPNENSMTHGLLAPYLVPELYAGPFNEQLLTDLAKGKETVSGKELHIKEGIVVRPKFNRRSKEGFPLFLKIINPKYIDDDEAIN